jgi:hypothetical protein
VLLLVEELLVLLLVEELLVLLLDLEYQELSVLV